MLGPLIIGPVLTLAPPSLAVVAEYSQWLGDVLVSRYLKSEDRIRGGSEQQWLDAVSRSRVDIIWSILIGNRQVGLTGIYAINWQSLRGNTGIVIGESEAWGRGYASEAVRMRTQYAFTETSLQRLHAEVFANNVAARRIIEKVGYKQRGTSRHHVFQDGIWHDVWLGEILREEWEKRAAVSP